MISFYKKQIEIAALFPTDKDKICDWIENSFDENIILTINKIKQYFANKMDNDDVNTISKILIDY